MLVSIIAYIIGAIISASVLLSDKDMLCSCDRKVKPILEILGSSFLWPIFGAMLLFEIVKLNIAIAKSRRCNNDKH